MMVHQGDFYLNEIEESGPAPAKLTLTFNPTNLLSQYKEAKTRTWDNKTIGDIASQIALENGVTPRIDTNLKDIVIDHIDQIRQTDVHFLSNMLRNYKGILKLTSRLLVVATRQSLSSITGIPLNTVLIDLSSVKSYTATTQMASEYSGVKVYVKNTDTAETEEILVGEETNNDKTKDKAVTVIRTPFANRTEATKAGQTKLNSLKRKKQTMKITVLGDPTIKAERALELVNTRRPFPVNWLTSLVKHTISKQGFVTEIDCELPTAKDSKVGVVSQALKDKVAASREGNVKFNNTTGKYDIVKPDSTKINNKK
jgi:phage protein D